MGISFGASPELSTTVAAFYTRALRTARAWFASTSGCCSLATGRMLIPKKNRVEVYKYLFQEGVLYAKKDFNAPKHPEIDVPNLQVIKLMQSFKSKEYVKESFAWRHYYWSVFLLLSLVVLSVSVSLCLLISEATFLISLLHLTSSSKSSGRKSLPPFVHYQFPRICLFSPDFSSGYIGFNLIFFFPQANSLAYLMESWESFRNFLWHS